MGRAKMAMRRGEAKGAISAEEPRIGYLANFKVEAGAGFVETQGRRSVTTNAGVAEEGADVVEEAGGFRSKNA